MEANALMEAALQLKELRISAFLITNSAIMFSFVGKSGRTLTNLTGG